MKITSIVNLLDNKYQIDQLLGQGGMGAVYRATHLGTKRTVAVKLIQPQLSAHDQFVARFRREAEAPGACGTQMSWTLPISGSRKPPMDQLLTS